MKYERCYFKQVSSIKKSICSQTFSLVVTEGSLYAQTLSTYSPTVPGGDTPCLTAGDARRANPWTDDSTNLRRRRRRTAAHFCTSELPLHAFSATPPASGSELSACPRVPPRFARVSPAVTHGAPPPEALLCVDVDAEEVQ